MSAPGLTSAIDDISRLVIDDVSIPTPSSSSSSSSSSAAVNSSSSALDAIIAHFSNPSLLLHNDEASASIEKAAKSGGYLGSAAEAVGAVGGYLGSWVPSIPSFGGFGRGAAAAAAAPASPAAAHAAATPTPPILTTTNTLNNVESQGGVEAIPGVSKSPLTPKEKFWLSSQTITRFLSASRGNEATAIQRLEDTLVWRRGFGVEALIQGEKGSPAEVLDDEGEEAEFREEDEYHDEVDPEDVEEDDDEEENDVRREAARCKHFYLGTTAGGPGAGGHLIHYVRPTPLESVSEDAQIRHAVWFLEMGDALLPTGQAFGEGGVAAREPQGGTIMLVDMATTRNKKPSLAMIRQALNSEWLGWGSLTRGGLFHIPYTSNHPCKMGD